MIPAGFYIAVVAAFGLVIGSFLNVVIYRLHTGRSLNDRSHCLSCGRQLEWFELFPLLSYIWLRGRCRGCHSFIPYRYALVECLTAAAFLLAYSASASWMHFIFLAALLSLLIIGLVYDLYHMIIPDEVSYGAIAVAAGIIILELLTGAGTWYLLSSVLGALMSFLAYASLWYFSQGRAFGFGDAKLAVSLGALTGVSGVFSLVVLSFWVGALVSLVLMGIDRLVLNRSARGPKGYRVNMKSEIPFAPFLIAAFLLVYFFKIDVLGLVEVVYVAL